MNGGKGVVAEIRCSLATERLVRLIFAGVGKSGEVRTNVFAVGSLALDQ